MLTHFTIYKDEAIDRRVQADLDIIVSELRKRVPDLIAIILTGGFSRGEGSIIWRGEEIAPLNDYDIVVVTEKTDRTLLAPLENELAARIGIRHIDLLPRHLNDLPTLPCTMFDYDMRHGGRVLWGPRDMLALIPAWHERDIALAEAEILLFNRMICLLEAFSLEFLQRKIDEKERFFLRFQTAKGVLAASDALLVIKRRYHFLYQERAERFAMEFKFRPEWVEMVRQATIFKLNPTNEPSTDPIRDWKEASRFLLATLESILPLRYPYGFQFQGWPNTAEFYAIGGWRSCVEICEMLLLAAISSDAVGLTVDEELAQLAGRHLSCRKELPEAADWEAIRRLVVDVWHRKVG